MLIPWIRPRGLWSCLAWSSPPCSSHSKRAPSRLHAPPSQPPALMTAPTMHSSNAASAYPAPWAAACAPPPPPASPPAHHQGPPSWSGTPPAAPAGRHLHPQKPRVLLRCCCRALPPGQAAGPAAGAAVPVAGVLPARVWRLQQQPVGCRSLRRGSCMLLSPCSCYGANEELQACDGEFGVRCWQLNKHLVVSLGSREIGTDDARGNKSRYRKQCCAAGVWGDDKDPARRLPPTQALPCWCQQHSTSTATRLTTALTVKC